MKKLSLSILLSLSVLAATFLVLELAARILVERPQTITIEDLESDVPSGGKQTIETRRFADRALYVKTPTGLRLKTNAHVVVRNHAVSKRDIEITTNSHGFRHAELGEKTEDEFRILVLGDSITFGGSVNQDETYPARIGRHLEDRPPSFLDGKNIQVVNAGIGSIDLQNEFAVLMDKGLDVEPDVVLVGLYLNDANASLYLKVTRLPSLLQRSRFLGFVANRFDVLRARYRSAGEVADTDYQLERKEFLKRNRSAEVDWSTDERGFNMLISVAFKDWGYAWSDAYWEKVQEILELMQEASQSEGFELVVLLFPVAQQVHAEILKDEPQRKFEALMQDLEIEHLSLLPALREKYRRDRANVFFDQCHPTVEGNDFVGQEVAAFLARTLECRRGRCA